MRMDDKRNHYKMDAIGLISILQNNNNCLFVFFFFLRTGLFTMKVYCCWACPIQHCLTGAFRLCQLRTPNGGFCSHTHITHRPKTYTDH